MPGSIEPIDRDFGLWQIIQHEAQWINQRRQQLGRPEIAVEQGEVMDAVGLALSGGGIRSAAICLGVLQALNKHSVLRNIDYLSTVSGGGYIGSSLTATMTEAGGEFVLGPSIAPSTTTDKSETLAFQVIEHLRNYSNYLLPAGKQNLGSAMAVVLRGLVANLAIVLPFLLVAAAVTIWIHPNASALVRRADFYSVTAAVLPGETFGITFLLILLGFAAFFSWALYSSLVPLRIQLDDTLSTLSFVGAIYILCLFVTFVCELQPLLIAGMFDAVDPGAGDLSLPSLAVRLIQLLAVVSAPAAALVMFFRHEFADFLKSAAASSDFASSFLRLAGQGTVWLAAAALPLVIWATYLHLSYWGIIDDRTSFPPGSGSHTPAWMVSASELISRNVLGIVVQRPLVILYISVGGLLFLLSGLLKANTLSLHGLYRDRLRRAFVFDLKKQFRGEFAPLRMPLSAISAEHAPYHLINGALNIRGSEYANRKGRDADFFLFSPLYVGSRVTGYAPTRDFEKVEPSIDLATAMAISGAAVSSSMGASSIRLLSPMLALLNIRLGYWLRNPRFLDRSSGIMNLMPLRLIRRRSSYLFWSEVSGRVYTDKSDEVYVTDGGHIENLGLYELLRRRCRVIVCVDAEADPEMRFNSLITLQRYASTDQQIEIDLPWRAIQSSSVRWMGYDPLARRTRHLQHSCGPHAAIGTIDYGDGQRGFLVYLKSSLTGDERDYVGDYARRHARFPHESTGNQFFNEEQFEVYRALGFHMMDGLLSGRGSIEVASTPGSTFTFNSDAEPLIKAVRGALR